MNTYPKIETQTPVGVVPLVAAPTGHPAPGDADSTVRA